MRDPLLASRLRIAVRGDSARQVADRVGMNPETVRRYLNGISPSAEFLTAICRVYGVLGTWLLCSEGPRTEAERPEHLLGTVSTRELAQQLVERLSRIENRLGTLEQSQRPSESVRNFEIQNSAAVSRTQAATQYG